MLLSGRFRDPLVGGHIVVGAAFGVALALWSMLKMAMLLSQGRVTPQDWRMLGGLEWMINSLMLNLVWVSVVKAFAICVLLLFAKVLLRRDWLATAAVVLLANVPHDRRKPLLVDRKRQKCRPRPLPCGC